MTLCVHISAVYVVYVCMWRGAHACEWSVCETEVDVRCLQPGGLKSGSLTTWSISSLTSLASCLILGIP